MLLGQSQWCERYPRVKAGLDNNLLHGDSPSRLGEMAILANVWKPAKRVKEKNEETE